MLYQRLLAGAGCRGSVGNHVCHTWMLSYLLNGTTATAWSRLFHKLPAQRQQRVILPTVQAVQRTVSGFGKTKQNGKCSHNALQLTQTPWASYQIKKMAGCACAGNAGNVFPRRRFKRKPLVSDPGMHHGTCVTHVPWCMSGSLTCGDGENVPGIPGACAPAILRIWQEAHVTSECAHNTSDDSNQSQPCLTSHTQPYSQELGTV